jgi:hypothetical protein
MKQSVSILCLLLLSCVRQSPSKQAVSATPEKPSANIVDTTEPFAIVCIDDTKDLFGAISEEKIPPGSGIAIFQETVPIGLKHFAVGHFARIVSRPNESSIATQSRFSSWAERATSLAPSERFGFAEIIDYDPATKIGTPVGLRTYLLTGANVIDHRDVAEAHVVEGDEDVPEISIAMKLDKSGTKKLQVATNDWAFRRLAILSHGKIEAAPVVKASIDDGELQLVIGPRSDAIITRAKKLVEEILHK